jgi:hypothetical protein
MSSGENGTSSGENGTSSRGENSLESPLLYKNYLYLRACGRWKVEVVGATTSSIIHSPLYTIHYLRYVL